MTTQSEKIITIGKIGAPFGVKGWVYVHSISGQANFFELSDWMVKSGKEWVLMSGVECKRHSKKFVAKLPGCDDRDKAAEYTNQYIGTERENLPELEENEFYWNDLLGCNVFANDKNLGEVVEIIETGANDVLAIEGNGERILIPFVLDEYILSVNLTDKKIIVDWE